MKSTKIRHQLFLPEETSRRLEHLATSSGRARSEILVEALDAWFNRRQAPHHYEENIFK
jgi:predicted transcriptional regulator